jgi:hypothetical protein
MAVITGNTGSVTIGAADPFLAIIVHVTEWTGSIENEFFDRRIFAAATDYMQEYRGAYQMTGTITGFLDGTVLPAIGDFSIGAGRSTLTLTSNDSQTYVMEAYLHNFTPSVNRRTGLNTYTANFRSYGNITSLPT